jgi:Holliday junction resolvase-like predicted endonuclease
MSLRLAMPVVKKKIYPSGNGNGVMGRMGDFVNPEEDAAAQFLRTKGFVVQARNARQFGAEIDILAVDSQRTHIYIVEVKKKRKLSARFIPAISGHQLRRLKNAAMAMQVQAERFLPVRVCLLLVDLKNGDFELIKDIV